MKTLVSRVVVNLLSPSTGTTRDAIFVLHVLAIHHRGFQGSGNNGGLCIGSQDPGSRRKKMHDSGLGS
ncbi:hypothetical protein PG994_011973 [Apiospora phragmitis]|uniref:Uncharacterized protein n=1 Tax=Apiospora phragmitis TaxID=2905665 RepID=A0ABR1TUL3_9PEZI